MSLHAAILFEILCKGGDARRQPAGSENCTRMMFHRNQSKRLSQKLERLDNQVALSLPRHGHTRKKGETRRLLGSQEIQGVQEEARLHAHGQTRADGAPEIGKHQAVRDSTEIQEVAHMERQLGNRKRRDGDLEKSRSIPKLPVVWANRAEAVSERAEQPRSTAALLGSQPRSRQEVPSGSRTQKGGES